MGSAWAGSANKEELFRFLIFNKAHYTFWFEPDAKLGSVLKLSQKRECSHLIGGDADYVHDYFTNPFVSTSYLNAELIRGGKKIKITESEKLNVKSPGILYSEATHYYFKFPELRSGDITSSEVIYTFRESRNIVPLFFAENSLIKDLKITFRAPSGIRVNPYFHNCDSGSFSLKRYTERKEQVIEISQQNVKQLSREANDDIPMGYYNPFVFFFIKAGKIDNTPIYPLANIDDLYRYNYNFLGMTPKADTMELKKLAEEITAGANTEREKLDKIFVWVREKIKYTALMEGKQTVVPEPATGVLASKYGDCKGMSSLLNGLASAAGIPLYYAWVGTRDIAYQPSEVPIPFAFNHMIAAYISNGDTLLLDATAKGFEMGEINSRLYGKEVMIGLNANQYAIYKVKEPRPEDNLRSVNIALKPSLNSWTGQYEARMLGEKKSLFNYIQKLPASYFEKKQKPNPVFPELTGTEVTITSITEGNVTEARMDWELTLDKGVIKTENTWLLNPIPDKYKELLSITTEDRKHPFEIEYPFLDRIHFSIEIPEGYELSSKPEDVVYNDELGEIICRYRIENGKIISEFSLAIKPLLVKPENFSKFTTLKSTLKKCITEYLVFKKQE